MKMNNANEKKRIESKLEVQAYIDRLKYAIESGSATINFQKERQVDKNRDREHTNRYTMSKLFPNEDEVEVLKRELTKLTVKEYIETVEDTRFSNKSEMRVFGKQYEEKDVYIKIRVELVSAAHASGNNYVFVMSFHFAEMDFKESDFPYR
ncbi:MAG TPA: hypothetical protein GX527_01285 [Clostridiaceae bacterium]|nr:hypothetical protein [Clostridiaceae bacterium]